MTDPAAPHEPTGSSSPTPPARPKQPNLVVGMSLLSIAAVLIVVVLIQPEMSSGLKVTIAIAAVAVVAALLGYAFVLWKSTQRGGRRK